MPKKMLINALHAEEARVAIVEDGRLMDLGIEIAGREQTRGNVYKGVVVRVEPGLQAAFIDIGLKKLGFLQMGELHPEFWQWRDDVPQDSRNRRPRIQEVLRRGQELLVQVEKGERDMKGAAVTSYLSLPGRYMVLMPGSDSAGVSRKVEAEGERKKLKEMAAELNIPEGIGFIIRTEALGKKQAELAKDFHYLLKLNESIREAAARVKGPALIYQESDLIIRTIRDYFTSDIDEVLVDSVEVYEQAKAFFKEVMPRMAARVKLHQEKRPIFSRYQLEEQIDQIYEKKVLLKSGGSLVIEPAEALVSIDVNSGKSTGERGVEDTAYKTNMEAAEEAARQLRLRDLGGLIVIDFIDMRDRKHNADVEKTLKHALKSDKARVTVGKISQFGLLEMSRQRIRQTANEAVYLECPHCEGRGRIKSVEAMAVSFLRKVHGAAAKGTIGEVRGGLPLEVAYYLLNRKKKDLARIEADYDIEVTLKGKPSFLMNQIELELLKREKPSSEGQSDGVQAALVTAPVFPKEEEYLEEEESEAAEESLETTEEPAALEETGEAGKKRKRRRGKKKPQEGESSPVEGGDAAEESEQEPGEDDESESDSSVADLEGEAGEEPSAELPAGSGAKKRKRRRKRNKSVAGASPETVASMTSEPDDSLAGEPDEEGGSDASESPSDEGTEEGGVAEEAKKKRRRRRRGAKRRTEEESSAEGEEAEVGDLVAVEPVSEESSLLPDRSETPAPIEEAGSAELLPVLVKKPRTPRPRKMVADAADEGVTLDEEGVPSPEKVVKAPAGRSRSPRKPAVPKLSDVTPESSVTLGEEAGSPQDAATETQPTQAVPRPRAPRKKKENPGVVAGEAVASVEGDQSAPAVRKRGPRKKSEPATDEPV